MRQAIFNKINKIQISKLKTLLIPFFILLGFLGFAQISQAASPILFFSDITSGPKTGLGDGLGQGAIVTIWGNNLGSSQGNSKVYFKDSSGNSYEAAYIYYWKNADGQKPGGPAELYSYQRMQEIAFSIPSQAADGLGQIYVEVNGVQSNTLTFTVRLGNIYFVKAMGNNSTGNGSWNAPWGTLNYVGSGAGGRINAGDIVYATDGIQVNSGLAVKYIDGTADSPISIISYAGGSVILQGSPGPDCVICNWFDDAEYWNFSKLIIRTQHAGITAFKGMRSVANEITNYPGGCADGMSGAITGSNANYPSKGSTSGIKAIGNYIHDFGCDNTSSLHHVFYISNRGGLPVESFELGWNFLKDNKANGGLHIYDQTICGDWIGPMNIHDNVVVNQRGPGFSYGAGCSYPNKMTMDVNVYNNLFINTGLGPPFINAPAYISPVAVSFGGNASLSRISFYDNTIYGYGDVTLAGRARAIGAINDFTGTWEWRNNIVVDTKDLPYYSPYGAIPSVSSNNLWYNGGDGVPASVPSWDIGPIAVNPLFIDATSNDFHLQSNSPAVNAGASLPIISRDLDGTIRPQGSLWDIGAYEYVSGGDTTPPSNPTGLSVI